MPKKQKKKKGGWQRKCDVQKKSFKNPFFKRRKSFNVKAATQILIFVCIFVLSYLAFYFLYFSPYNQIKAIEVRGVDIEVTTTIRDLINRQLHERRFLIFRQDNVFSFNESQALDSIMELLAFQTIELSINNGNLLIEISEQKGVLRWSTSSGIYLLNEQGLALRHLREFEPVIESRQEIEELSPEDLEEFTKQQQNTYNISLILDSDPKPLVYDYSNQSVTIGEIVVRPEVIKNLLDLQTLTKKYIKIPIISFEIDNIESSKVQLNTIEGWEVYMNLLDFDTMERDILRLMVLLNKKFVDGRSGVEYIDLRSGEKIYYQ